MHSCTKQLRVMATNGLIHILYLTSPINYFKILSFITISGMHVMPFAETLLSQTCLRRADKSFVQ